MVGTTDGNGPTPNPPPRMVELKTAIYGGVEVLVGLNPDLSYLHRSKCGGCGECGGILSSLEN